MYMGYHQEEQIRHQEVRDQDRGIRTREEEAERIRTTGGKIHDALTFGEQEPASGRERLR